MPDISVEVRGLAEAKAKLEQVAEDIHGKPMVNTMKKATAMITRSAKQNLSKPTIGVKYPTVNSGQLRNSITPEVYSQHNILKGVVGSNVKRAPYMETGTGRFVGRPTHVPPIRVLKVWAEQKKRGGKSINPYVVQLAIKRKGGLHPRKYLQRAFEDNQKEIQDMFGKTVSGIVSK